MNQSRKVGLVCVVMLAGIVGCSSSSSDAGGGTGPGTGGGSSAFSGTLEGQSLIVADGLFYVQEPYTNSDGTKQNQITIKLTSYANACKLQEQDDSHKANETYAKIKLKTVNSDGHLIVAGTYTLAADDKPIGDYAEVEVKKLDATCTSTKGQADSGTVTVSSVTSSEIKGTFDVKVGSESATGSFDVMSCGDGIGDGGGGLGTCLP